MRPHLELMTILQMTNIFMSDAEPHAPYDSKVRIFSKQKNYFLHPHLRQTVILYPTGSLLVVKIAVAHTCVVQMT